MNSHNQELCCKGWKWCSGVPRANAGTQILCWDRRLWGWICGSFSGWVLVCLFPFCIQNDLEKTPRWYPLAFPLLYPPPKDHLDHGVCVKEKELNAKSVKVNKCLMSLSSSLSKEGIHIFLFLVVHVCSQIFFSFLWKKGQLSNYPTATLLHSAVLPTLFLRVSMLQWFCQALLLFVKDI